MMRRRFGVAMVRLRIIEHFGYFRLWKAIHKRKNFLFADTSAGASASAMIYSVLESAKVRGHNVYRYIAVILSELPNAASLEQIESLLPWNLTTEQVNDRYAEFPTP